MKTLLDRITPIFTVICLVFCLFASARADVVSDWNAVATQAVATAGTARPGASGALDIATVHVAIYDAVQSIEKKYQPYYLAIPNASGSTVAAASAAAHDVLLNRFPGQAGALNLFYSNYLLANGILPGDQGLVVGAASAANIIALRASDGSFPPGPPTFIGGQGIGVWRPTPPAFSPMNPGPWLGSVTPFTLLSPSQFRSDPPPPLNSLAYAQAYAEVKDYGRSDSTFRSAGQTDQAQFWAGNFVVMMNALVRTVANGRLSNVSDSSRLFVLTSTAAADATINVWNDKAYYVFWRPITAIQSGDLDFNSLTDGDPTWTPLFPTPPYPDHTSGANGLAASTTRALRNYFQQDEISFSLATTNTAPTNQDVRSFTRLSDMAQEVVNARIFLGIHFRFADEGARTLGIRVADWGYSNYFRPVPTGRIFQLP
jgi:hypothetical protein